MSATSVTDATFQQQQQQPPATPSEAVVAASGVAAAAATPHAAIAAAPAMDFASILAKIQSLEKEKSDMRSQLELVSGKLTKLQESKRSEMEQMMNSTISKWLENLDTKDSAAKQQLREGLNRLVQQGDESGVWNVIACASSNWIHNVNQIEQLTSQLNEYREKERMLSGGIFQAEESRVAAVPVPGHAGEKRRFDEIGSTHGGMSSAHSDHDIWSEFQGMMMSVGGNRGYGVESFFQQSSSQPPQQ
jgi:hypothetical protein